MNLRKAALSVALMLISLLAFVVPLRLLQAQGRSLSVFYAGEEDAVAQALDMVPALVRVDSPELADVAVVHNRRLPEEQARAIGTRVAENGMGVVLLFGPDMPPEANLNHLLNRGGVIASTVLNSPQSLRAAPGVESGELDEGGAYAAPDPLLTAIAWSSAPQVRERTVYEGVAYIQPVVSTVGTGEVVLGRVDVGRGRIYTFAPWLALRPPLEPGGRPASFNEQLRHWPYFNYLIYRLVAQAADLPAIVAFGAYPAAPVPRAGARLAIAGGAGLMVAGAAAAFWLLRRYTFIHPEASGQLAVRPDEEARQPAAWEQVGFHRPLAGFLFLMAVGLILFIPLMGYQALALPGYLLPWPQAVGFWDTVVRWFEVFWLVFDLGTGVAAVKYFSQYRVEDPQRGLKFLQFYVWWQAISGTVQLAAVALVAATVIPQTALAHLSFYFMAHALIQFPGFLRVFGFVFRAFQRFDYEQVLTLVLYMGPIVLQSAMVIVMRAWGAANPVFGEAMGGVIGMGLGLYLAEWLAFLVGLLLYKRLGFALRSIFLPTFDRRTVVTALKFGLKLTWGEAFAPLGHFVQTSIIAAWMFNWGEVQGNWSVAYAFILAYGALMAGLYDGLMPAMSEAYSSGRRQLTRYYVTQGCRMGSWYSLFILAGLAAVCDRFITGALGENYARAAQLVVPLLAWGAIQWPAWLGDRIQQAADRPELQAILMAGEQTLRIGLMFVFIRFVFTGENQVWGVLAAYSVALPIKGLISLLISHRAVVRVKIYAWQTLVAPLASAVVTYALLRWVTGLIWRGDIVTSLIIFLIALLPALPLYAFLTGLLGGWDAQNLDELRLAVQLSGIARPVSYLVYGGVALGARVSPLHGRFPISLHSAATAEAHELTQEKVPLA